jgi:Ni2+-binding GTPase involved in maturation of urease and hydrogenase
VSDAIYDRDVSDLAPCVAVVGPANSGKTTLLHRLDRALQEHPARPIACVVKGNPDGTGRYLFEAPEQRDALKTRVKGAWRAETVATVRDWIGHARSRIELLLVDFGGKHAPVNASMLARCTHFIVVARAFDDPAREREEGMQSWIDGVLPASVRDAA